MEIVMAAPGDYDVLGEQSLWEVITHNIYPDFIDPTEGITLIPVSYTHLTLPTIYSV